MEYLGFVGALIALIIIVKLLKWPLKKLFKLVFNVLIGGALLFLFNYFGGAWFGFTLPINWITCIAVGLLGIPGFIGVAIFYLFF